MEQYEFDRIMKRLIPDGNCLIWPGAHTDNPSGVWYPVGRIKEAGKTVALHRAVYAHLHDDLPEGRKEVVEHTCHKSLCLNPDHLKVATQRDNLLHSPNTVNSINSAKTHCIRDHLFDEANTYWTASGTRACRACKAMHAREYYAAKKKK